MEETLQKTLQHFVPWVRYRLLAKDSKASLRTGEVADILGVNNTTILRWRRLGLMKAFGTDESGGYRFLVSDIIASINNNGHLRHIYYL